MDPRKEHDPPPSGVARYRFGDTEFTFVSDGPLHLGDPRQSYPGAPADDVAAFVARDGHAGGEFVLQQNCLVVKTPRHQVLVDTGTGADRLFGSTTGHLRANLEAAGFALDAFTHVLITHPHADHVGGLVTDRQEPVFENARIVLPKVDHDFWTDRGAVPPGGILARVVDAVAFALVPLRDRIDFLDGAEPLPGARAVPTPGHTVGHVSYLFDAGDTSVLTLGDVAHHPLCLRHPDWKFFGDADPALGCDTRRRVFDMAASERCLVAAYHFPFPGLVRVVHHATSFDMEPV